MEEYADVELERKILSLLLRKFSRQYKKQVFRECFTRELNELLFDFILNNNFEPSEDFERWWRLWKVFTKKRDLKENVCEKFLRFVWREELVDEEEFKFYLETLKGFSYAREMRDILNRVVRLYKDMEVLKANEELDKGVRKLNQKYREKSVERYDYLEDFSKRLEDYSADSKTLIRIPTGLPKLDRLLNGGIVKPSLSFVFGETNIGKSFLLQEIGLGAFISHYHVLYVTVELAASTILTRLDSRLSRIDYNKLDIGQLDRIDLVKLKKRIKSIEKDYEKGGTFSVSFIPEGCTSGALESELEIWSDRLGKGLDVLIVDHADLMESSRRGWSEQESHGNVFRDLKHLSHTHNLSVWTAAHVSKAAYGKTDLDLGDIGYSAKKIQISNLAIALTRNETEDGDKYIRLKVVKNSFGRIPDEGIILYPDFSVSNISWRSD